MSEALPPSEYTSTFSAIFDAKSYRAANPTTIIALPNTTSGDYDAMSPYWKMIDSILGGTEAMRKAGATYLPKFPNEGLGDWKYRLANSVFTNIYSDIVSGLSAKPFAEECTLEDAATQQFKDLADDIDGRGNSLHVFAGETFFWGVNYAIDWILVDYPKAQYTSPRPLSIADEKAQGLRPYWVKVPATKMNAVYSACVNGKEIFVHARISEIVRERLGFYEVSIERIRIFNRDPIIDQFNRVVGYQPATYEVWEKQSLSGAVTSTANAWQIVEQGPITIGIIPIVPFITGKRIGSSWQFIPVMRDCAWTQIELYQAETGLKSLKELTAFPMLTGNGVAPPGIKEPQIKVGGRAILYAPPVGEGSRGHGEWKYIEPQATSLKFLADEIDRIEKQMRELGRQPLTANSGNLTVVTTAFAAQKGNSAVQQWALNLKDALEQAMYITALWLGQSDSPDVKVYTDFSVDADDDKGIEWLMDMAKRGRLSTKTEWEEAQRRNVLSPDFDPDKEDQQIASEAPPPPTAADLQAALSGGVGPKPKVPAAAVKQKPTTAPDSTSVA